jgi:hypothetical protein
VLRKIFGPKRDEVIGEWRRLRSRGLHDLCSSPNSIRVIKSRKMRWAVHMELVGNRRRTYRALLGRRGLKRPFGRLERRWGDNIEINLQEVGYEGMNWIDLAQDRYRWRAVASAVMNLRVP